MWESNFNRIVYGAQIGFSNTVIDELFQKLCIQVTPGIIHFVTTTDKCNHRNGFQMPHHMLNTMNPSTAATHGFIWNREQLFKIHYGKETSFKACQCVLVAWQGYCSFNSLVITCVKSIQSGQKIISGQNASLQPQSLFMVLWTAVGIGGPVYGSEVLLDPSDTAIITYWACEHGSYVNRKKIFIELIEQYGYDSKKIFVIVQHNNKSISAQILQDYILHNLKFENKYWKAF